MGKKIYGELVIANDCLDDVIEGVLKEDPTTVILEKKESTVDDIFDIVQMHSVAEYGSKHHLYTTIIYSKEMSDDQLENFINNINIQLSL